MGSAFHAQMVREGEAELIYLMRTLFWTIVLVLLSPVFVLLFLFFYNISISDSVTVCK